MTEPTVVLSVENGLARITLNRPARMNAFEQSMAHAWADACAEATSRDDVQAILIDAAGPSFCAGGDVLAMAQGMGEFTIEELAHTINSGILALVQSSIPVVAAAHGTTAGGGLGILLASDYVIVGNNSKIGSLYANIGLTPDLSVSASLAKAVGARRALQLVLSDRLLSAEQALDWGLVAEVVAADEVQVRAEEVAQSWLTGAVGAYGQAKRLIRSQPARTFAEQLAEEARSINAAFDTPEAQARVQAFADRSARKAQ